MLGVSKLFGGRVAPRANFGRQVRRIRFSENQTFALMAIVVGLAGGLAAVGFHHLIDFLCYHFVQ